jgi:hypothetical protein
MLNRPFDALPFKCTAPAEPPSLLGPANGFRRRRSVRLFAATVGGLLAL